MGIFVKNGFILCMRDIIVKSIIKLTRIGLVKFFREKIPAVTYIRYIGRRKIRARSENHGLKRLKAVTIESGIKKRYERRLDGDFVLKTPLTNNINVNAAVIKKAVINHTFPERRRSLIVTIPTPPTVTVVKNAGMPIYGGKHQQSGLENRTIYRNQGRSTRAHTSWTFSQDLSRGLRLNKIHKDNDKIIKTE